MPELGSPWLVAMLAAPLLAAAGCRARMEARTLRWLAGGAALASLLGACGALVELRLGGSAALADPLDPTRSLAIDALSAPLLPCWALIGLATLLALPSAALWAPRLRRLLVLQAAGGALLCCRDPLPLLVCWSLTIIPPALELRSAGSAGRGALRLFLGAQGLSALLLACACLPAARAAAPWLVLAAAAIRCGLVPLHAWIPPFFRVAPLETAILFCAPQSGIYLAVRLALPSASAALLSGVALAGLATAVLAAGLSLVQREARRAYAFTLLSQSALVLAGIDCASAVGLAGGLCLQLSTALSLAGFGLTLAVLEARRGPLGLDRFHGGYEQMPLLAGCFLLLGLAAIGFPWTLGFAGQELLLAGVVAERPLAGFAVALAGALNGIQVLRLYFILFCGARSAGPEQRLLTREQLAFVLLALLLLAGGLRPGPLAGSRGKVAAGIVRARAAVAR